jgi:hypothetical protein
LETVIGFRASAWAISRTEGMSSPGWSWPAADQAPHLLDELAVDRLGGAGA